MIGSVGSAFLAGTLSTLSPCVLPLLPLVLGAATSQHRHGPVALAAGLAASFTAIGLFVATIGFSIGLDTEALRAGAALLLLVVGLVLLLPPLQTRFAVAAGPVGDWAERRFGGVSATGWQGQFAVGLLLGAVWSPCVGPTLGAASLLAARSEDLGGVALTMLAFGIGAALPLVALGFVSRRTLMNWRDRLTTWAALLKQALGAAFVLIAILILTGLDKRVEAVLVAASPDWLVTLTTRF